MSHHYQGAATSSPPDQPPPEVFRLTCEQDGRVHLATVSTVENDILNDCSTYTALCGHEVALALFGTPPGPDCLDCQQRPHQRATGGLS